MKKPAWHEYLVKKNIPMNENAIICSICPAMPGEQHISIEITPMQKETLS